MAISSTSSKKKGSIRVDLSWKTAGLVLGLLFCGGFIFATVQRAERIETSVLGVSQEFDVAKSRLVMEGEWLTEQHNEMSNKVHGLSRDNKKLLTQVANLNEKIGSIQITQGRGYSNLEKRVADVEKTVDSAPEVDEEAVKKLAGIEAEIKRVLGMVEASKKSLVAQANVTAQYATVINKQARAIDKLLTIHKISADEAIK